jgi:S-adenosyl-L-methionine hydrolase (adenosine-forming)
MPSQKGTIALLTDFGLGDVYVGVMKGAIAKINPQLTVIDLTHQIPPQNILAGRFCLMNAYPYFPDQTVYLAVVDPGVGSHRRGVAIKFSQGFLVGPDNGLFSGILSLESAIMAVELTNQKYWRSPDPSSTFHGRDIFAPVAAHLANGVELQELGNSIELETLVNLPIANYQKENNKITGFIQYIDHFGNLITNIPSQEIVETNWLIKINNLTITSGKTYSDRPRGEAIALIGSHGWLEIAVNGGNAQNQLQLNWGDQIDCYFS